VTGPAAGRDLVDLVMRLAEQPGVPDRVAAARDACAQLRWHPALRRRMAEAAVESRVRGAVASASLEGAVAPAHAVREVLCGARSWALDPDPVEQVLRGVVAATVDTERLDSVLLRSPRQALARLHSLAAAAVVPPEALGRPRVPGEDAVELADLGPAPAAVEATARLDAVVKAVLATPRLPVLVVSAVVHAEVMTARPFLRGNGVVARAVDRALVRGGGLDPTGVAVTEAGHAAGGAAAYLGALASYGSGGTAGVMVWIMHCCEAVRAAAAEGEKVADAVLAGRPD
jgi:hypothetical protein